MFTKLSNLSNSKKADLRISSFMLFMMVITVLAAFGVFNGLKSAEWLTPLNGFIINFGFFCQIFCVVMLLVKDKMPGERVVSTWSYIALLFTLGYGIGLISCGFNEPVFLQQYEGVKNPLGLTMMHWCVDQFTIFTAFVIFEMFDEKYQILPKWLRGIKMYVYAFTMIIGIGTSFVSGTTTVSGSIMNIWGIDVPPYVIIVVIGAAVAFSVLRGLHKGMRVMANITMVILFIFMFMMLFVEPSGWLGNSWNAIKSLVTDYGDIAIYHNTPVQNEYTSPIQVWNLGWAAFVAYFIVQISKGRSFRQVILFSMLIPTGLGMAYLCMTGNIGLELASQGVVYEDIHSAAISLMKFMPLVSIILMLFMFITSCDSQVASLDRLMSQGSKMNIVARKLMWIILELVFVTIVLLAGSKAAIQGLGFVAVPILIVLAIIYVFCIIKFYVNKLKVKKEV